MIVTLPPGPCTKQIGKIEDDIRLYSMKTSKLYLILLLSVLLAAGCAADEDPDLSEDRPLTVQRKAQRTPERTVQPPENTETVEVLVLGNSLAAGYGLNPEQAFPALLQNRADSLGWDVEIINAAESGLTTSGGLSRVDWLLRRSDVDVLILELGGNDGLRGISTEVTRENLTSIIERTRARFPDVRIVLAGMQVPPNLGHEYTERFRMLYPEIAEEQDALLIPFLLEGVGGVPELNQSDGIHPTAEGQRIVAQNVWTTLGPLLESLQQPV